MFGLVPEYQEGFLTFASATDVDPVSFSSITYTLEGVNKNITLTGDESHGDISLGFNVNDVPMMIADEGMITTVLDGPEPIRFVVVEYHVPNVNFNGMTSFNYTVSDDSFVTSSLTATITIFVNATNDAPVIGNLPEALSVKILEDESHSFSELNVTDVDGDIEAEVTLTATSTATLVQTSNLSFTVGNGTTDSVMKFNSSLTNINLTIDRLTYTPTKDFN